MAFAPRSLDTAVGSEPDAGTVADRLGASDPAIERMLGMKAVATHWGELPVREQQALVLRFYGNLTQDQIGAQLGVSQMQVSRILSSALGYLRPRVFGPAADPSG